jgi:hypothetical protein
MAKPDKLRVSYEGPDSGPFNAIGRLPDGTQFLAFVTGAFPTGHKYYSGADGRRKKKWLAVLHRFDADGGHLGTEARLGGYDVEGPAAGDEAFVHLERMLTELAARGRPKPCDIWVRPFAVEIDSVTHGLTYEQSEEEPGPGEERAEWVMLEPLDVMFHPPWDSGEYST